MYAVVSKAVEEGIDWGYMHAHKHTDTPTEHELKEHIMNDVMNAMCEVLDFDFGGTDE